MVFKKYHKYIQHDIEYEQTCYRLNEAVRFFFLNGVYFIFVFVFIIQ